MTTTLNQYTQQDYITLNKKLRYGKTDEVVSQILEDLEAVRPFMKSLQRLNP